MYVSETSCMKRTSSHNKNMGIKALKSQGLRICFDFSGAITFQDLQETVLRTLS